MSLGPFNRPGVSDKFLLAAGVEVVTEPPDALLRIPYHDREGHRTGHYRVRLKEARPDGQKYDQPSGSGVHVYFSHLPLSPGVRLWVTEGEFKALSMWEAGNPTIGLPGLHGYTRDENGNPQILPALYEAVRFVSPQEIVFIGDSDTILNIEYYRAGHFLATVFPNIQVTLLQLPFGSEHKGVDDLREAFNGAFPNRLDQLYTAALLAEREESLLLPATLRLQELIKTEAISALPPKESIKQRHRVCQMAAWAKLVKDEPQAILTQFLKAAQEVTGFNKETFQSSVDDELKEIRGETSGETVELNQKLAFYNAIKPLPTERPLADILAEVREITSRFIITDPRNFLLTSCWAAHTFPFRFSPYLPLLLFTGPEEDTGKSTYMRVVGRFSYRAFVLISTTNIHRILTKYQGSFLLDESKELAENKPLISFLNAGFDNISQHPVDSPILARHDMESNSLLEWDPRFPKILAGIGTFLERDTLSRSIVIPMERYLLSESKRIKDYFIDCTDELTLPVYRAFLAYWTEERQKRFNQICRSVIPKFPEEFRSRHRQKFVPILAIAEMAGPEVFDETLEAAKWKISAPDKSCENWSHRLLCDVARCLYRQMWLFRLKAQDPLTGAPSAIIREPKTDFYILPSKILLSLLLGMPEGPWHAWGDRRPKLLNFNELWEMLGNYRLEVFRKKIRHSLHRGLVYRDFKDRYERYVRAGDPTEDLVLAELLKELGPLPDNSGEDPKSSKSYSTGSTTSSLVKNAKSAVTAVTDSASGSKSKKCPVTALSENEGNSESAVTDQVIQDKQVAQAVTAVTPLLAISAERRVYIPPSTPQAAFCTPSDPERRVYLDLETFYPYGADYLQPPTYTPGQLAKRQREGKGHPYASDPRRCAIRFLTIYASDGSLGKEPMTIDLVENPDLPPTVLEAITNSTLVGHNLDFDVSVLRRYGIPVSSAVIDTMIASRLLGLGKQKRKFNAQIYEDISIAEIEEMELEAEEEDPNPVDHDLASTVRRYLRIVMEKAEGASDWGRKDITPKQRAYMLEDVSILVPLWEAIEPELQASKLGKVFKARMEFFHHLNGIKMTGIPVVEAQLAEDLVRVEKEKEAEGKKLTTEIFPDLEFEIPKSRKTKIKIKTSEGKTIFEPGPTKEGFRPNNRNQHWAPALAAHGIIVTDTRKPTLRRINQPECWALLKYAAAAKRLSEIKGTVRSIFPDGRVRAENWNQLAAVTGRIVSRGPNLQQAARDYRTGYRVEDPYFWLKADLSQIEMLIIAVVTGDPNMLEMIRAGKDIYVEYGARIFNKKPERGEGEDQITEKLRDIAKKPTLGIFYGQTPWGFVRVVKEELDIEYSIEEGQGFFDQYFEMFPKVAEYYEATEESAYSAIDVRTVAGTRRWLPPLVGEPSEDWEQNREFLKSLSYRRKILLNTPIQGSGADLVIFATNQFMPRLPSGVEVINLVHDEVDAIVTEATLRQTIQVITKAFQETFARLYPQSDLLPKIKFSIGPSWGELKELKLSK